MEPANPLPMLNLGCGSRFHAAWINLDIAPRDPAVRFCNLAQGIPFADAAVEVVYHSNVLEHIRHEQVPGFLRECWRVLRPGGIVRIAVPDLEPICRLYLERLDRADAGDKKAAVEYDWMLLELLDQCVRERSGGEMAEFLKQQPLPADKFVIGRIGNEGRELMAHLQAEAAQPKRPHRWWRFSGRRWRRRLAAWLTGTDPAVLEVGAFRFGGEVHQWMYDRFSLRRLLEKIGFVHVQQVSPEQSRIPGWSDYHLEVGEDGAIHKPDSLVMEGLKPG